MVQQADLNQEIEEHFDLVERVVYTIRNIRGEMKLPPGTTTDVHLIGSTEDPYLSIVRSHLDIISALVKVGIIQTHTRDPEIGFISTGMVQGIKVAVPMPEELLQQEKTRLLKEQERLVKAVQKLECQLANKDFVAQAPPELVEKQQRQLELSRKELNDIEQKTRGLCPLRDWKEIN